MKKFLSVLFITGAILAAVSSMPSRSYADCSEIYGGTQNCASNFTVVKTVQTPGTGTYVNNLSVNDPKYSPNQQVNFQIVVTNTGSQTIPTITVVDTFPQYLNFVSGPGTYDANAKTLTFTVSNLAAGQSTSPFYVSGQVVASNMLPSNQGTVCLINQALGTDNNGNQNSSSSQFCVQNSVLGASTPTVYNAPSVTTTPSTGPEMLPLALLFPGGLGGLILRKKSLKSLLKGGEK